MSHVIVIASLTVCYFLAYSFASKRQTHNCNDSVRIRECNIEGNEEDMVEPLELFRMKTNQMVANFRTDCKYDSIKYQWAINEEDDEHDEPLIKYDTDNIFTIKPFTLKKGSYGVSVIATLTRNGVPDELFSACNIDMISLDPVAVIEGGSKKTVEAGHEFMVDGSKSVDRDKPSDKPSTLVFKWTCQVLEGQVKDFCRKDYKGRTLKVPSSYAINNHKYLFTLNVRNQDSNVWATTTQTATILEKVTELEIICEKNCPPAAPKTDSTRLTFLRVKCLRHCSDLDPSKYEWTINSTYGFDYKKSTQYGRNSEKFIIKEGVLKPGTTYDVSVRLLDRNGFVARQLELDTPIKIDSCEVKPTEGTAIETMFSVDCKYTGNAYTFEIFSSKNGKPVTLTKNYKLEYLKFALPADVETFVKVVDTNGFQDVYKLNVDVKQASSDKVENFVDSIKTLTERGNIDKAVQIANGIVEEIKKGPQYETKLIKEAILQSLGSITMKSQDNARQIYGIVAKIVHDPKSESDPYQGEIATKVCKEASAIDLEHLKKEYHPTSLLDEVQENSRTLMMCGETDTKENFDIVKPVPLDFNVTTPFPVLEMPVIEEEYPDYDSDESVAVKKKKYELASKNLVGICKNALEMIGLTVVEGEETVVAATDHCSTQVTRMVGKELVGMKIKIQGAAFWVSRDVEKVEDVVDVMVCSWRHDPFWWNPSGKSVSTNVVLVRVVRDQKEVSTFEKPNNICLDLHDGANKKIKVHELEIFENSVIRIEVKKGEAFFVEFSKQSQLRVLISNFDKPDVEEIKEKGKEVTEKENVVYQEEVNGFDSWYYISVLPETKKVTMSVYTKSCYSWNIPDKTWLFACKGEVTSAENEILCSCNHLSILAGVIYNNPIKIDKVETKPDFEMVLLSSNIIFICVATTFALYCFFLTITILQKTRKSKTLYLLGDISSSSRYAYVLAIKTGGKRLSGTSSNICIKLYGDQSKSNSHVLNYPDPQIRIFQRNNTDWFILPTLNSLGDLREIALWSDYSGRSPRWFCTSVKVYDLQSNQEWYFKVNSWFDVPPKHQVYRKFQHSVENTKEKNFVVLWRLFPKRTHQNGLDKLTKLTLLLSIFLTIFLNCIVMLGPPRLHLNDGFAKIEKYGFCPEVIWIGLGSAGLTFVYHMTMIWFFKNGGHGKRYSSRVVPYCWVLLSTILVVLITILVVFGFWVPLVNGWLWLTSVLIAVLVYFLILENIYDICTNLFKTEEPVKLEKNWNRILKRLEYHRTYLFRKIGENVLRPYITALYRPLDEDGIKERKLKAESRSKLFALLEDTIMFFCYVTLLYLAIFANKNPMTVKNHVQMIHLLSGHHTHSESYTEIKSIHDIYLYVNTTLIPTIHAQQWYSQYVAKEPGIMADFHNKLLGVARLRQKRVVTHVCNNSTCRSEFWDSEQSRENFGPEYNELARLSHVWNYTDAEFAGYSVYVGKFGIYHGGGFLAPLGRTWFNSYANLLYLMKNTWLDSATSVVMIEFLSYNVNTNLFNAVRIVLERSSTGYLRTILELTTAQFLFVKDEEVFIQLVIFSSFILTVVIFSIKFVSRLWKGKFLVLSDLWFLVDLLIVGLSYSCFVLYISRSESVKTFLDKIEKMKKNEFINYFGLFYLDATFTLVAAFLVFVATIRLWKVCRYGTVFKVMEKTVLLSLPPILVILLFHLVIIFAFTFWGCLIFGDNSTDFKDIPDTILTMLLVMMGLQNFDFKAFLHANPILSRVYYTTYNLINLLFLTVYVAVIMIYYYQARVDVSQESDFETIKQFLFKELLFYKVYLKVRWIRLKGGSTKSKRQFVTPKPDDLLYADCFTIPSKTLEMMRCIALGDLKKYSMTAKEKIKLMLRVVRSLGDSDDVDVFFSEKTERKIEIIHENKVKRVAAAAELILSDNEKSRKREEKRYKKVIAKQLKKLDSIKTKLDIILQIVSNINVE